MGMFGDVSKAAKKAVDDVSDAAKNAGGEIGNAAEFARDVGQYAWENFKWGWVDPVTAEYDGTVEGALRTTGMGVYTALMLSPYQQVLPAVYLGDAAIEVAAERGWIDPLTVSENSPIIRTLADGDKAVRAAVGTPVWEAYQDQSRAVTEAHHDVEKSMRKPGDNAMDALAAFDPIDALVLAPFAVPLGNYKAAEVIVDAGVRHGLLDPSASEPFDTAKVVDAITDAPRDAEKAAREVWSG